MSFDPIEETAEDMRATRTRELEAEEDAQGRALTRPELTKHQVEFLEVFSACSWMPMDEIRQQVGIRKVTLKDWMDNSEEFRKALNIHYNQVLRATRMSRKQVMKGILEAIDMAKDQRLPNAMITGWKEIGRMCGFYEPERHEVTHTLNGKQLLEDMRTMSREALIAMAQEKDDLEAEYIRIEEDV